MSTNSNTRPIVSTSGTDITGRVYRCLRCDYSPFEGERSKVILHIYRKHVSVDQVPFYCNICKFIATAQGDLEKHVNPQIYPPHKAIVEVMRTNGQEVNEADSLLQNIRHYTIKEQDMVHLKNSENVGISLNKKRKKANLTATAAELSNINTGSQSVNEITETLEPIPSPSLDFTSLEDPFVPTRPKKTKCLPLPCPTRKLPAALQKSKESTVQHQEDAIPMPSSKTSVLLSSPSPSGSCAECKKTSKDVESLRKELKMMHQDVQELKGKVVQMQTKLIEREQGNVRNAIRDRNFSPRANLHNLGHDRSNNIGGKQDNGQHSSIKKIDYRIPRQIHGYNKKNANYMFK